MAKRCIPKRLLKTAKLRQPIIFLLNKLVVTDHIASFDSILKVVLQPLFFVDVIIVVRSIPEYVRNIYSGTSPEAVVLREKFCFHVHQQIKNCVNNFLIYSLIIDILNVVQRVCFVNFDRVFHLPECPHVLLLLFYFVGS